MLGGIAAFAGVANKENFLRVYKRQNDEHIHGISWRSSWEIKESDTLGWGMDHGVRHRHPRIYFPDTPERSHVFGRWK